jgi:hypothetical protein
VDGRLATWDCGEGRPLLFIHGVGPPARFGRRIFSELAAACHLIV